MTTGSKTPKDQYLNQQSSDAMLKLLLIGNSGVGKSCILMQFSENKFTNNFYNTIGVDYVPRSITQKVKYVECDGQKVKLQIWDTAGQDRFKTITSSYYRGAHGIVIVYDVTDRDSFQAVKNWIGEIDKYSDEKVFKFLVGNKSDLADRRQVSTQQGQKYGTSVSYSAERLNMPFFETSAKLAQNISTMFSAVTDSIMRSTQIKPTKPSSSKNIQSLLADKEKQKNSSNCC